MQYDASRCAADNERGLRRLIQFRDPYGMPPQKIFNPRRPVVAFLELDHSWWRAAGPGEIEIIRISRYDSEPVSLCILPNLVIRCETGETRVEDVNGSGEKACKTANQLGRKICVEQEFQRDLRSRPASEA